MSFNTPIIDKYGNTDLINAILEEDRDLAIELIDTLSEEELGVNRVNYSHRDALQLACQNAMAEVALRLIDVGADTNYVGGEGHKAIDYAIVALQSAKKNEEDLKSQIPFAAEDEQWDLLCEFRDEQKKSAIVAKEMQEVVEVLESRLPGAESEDVEESKDRLKTLLMQYLRVGRTSTVAWISESRVPWMLFFLHMMRTYRHSMCYVNTKIETGLSLWFDLEKKIVRASLDSIPPYSDMDSSQLQTPSSNAIKKANTEVLENIVSQIAKCLRKGTQQVIIPITLDDANDRNVRHMNMLIFRSRDWSLEHYEPHGKTNLIDSFDRPEGIAKNELLNELVSSIFKRLSVLLDRRLKKWKSNKDKPPIKLLTSIDTCPSHIGFQALQTRNKEFEASGLCSVWSLFISELSAMYPSLSLRQIQNTIYSKLAEYDVSMAGDFLLNVIKGFVARILETTRVYSPFFEVGLDEWTFDNIIRKKPFKKIKWLSWFESQSAYDANYAHKRIAIYKKDPNGVVGKEEAKYAANYLALWSKPSRKTRKRRTS